MRVVMHYERAESPAKESRSTLVVYSM